MWEHRPEQQLIAWNLLREQCKHEENLDIAISAVHTWWQECPTKLRYLHWTLPQEWPNPWDLIADDIYCELAKCLGISYTILMLDNKYINDLCIQETTDGSYIVSVNQGKYILNWDVSRVLNISSIEQMNIHNSMDSAMFAHNIR